MIIFSKGLPTYTIPLGEYEILTATSIGYRLETKDTNKGNDMVDGTDPLHGNLRLHEPGSGLSFGGKIFC